MGERLARLAARQHGVANRRQLLHLGFTRHHIAHLVAHQHLHPVHRGVYAVGHAKLTREGRWMAAVLAGGSDAVLTYQSAGTHRRILKPSPSLPHITTPHKGRHRPGIHHHTANLPADEISVLDGIPTTTVARTLLDLAGCLDPHRLERAIAEALYRGYTDSPSLPELIDRYPGRRGVEKLRRILASGNPQRGVTLSPLEERFLPFLDARKLKRPETNAPMEIDGEWIKVDCLWRAERVALELDSRGAHLRESNFESDRSRDRRLTARGWRPVRVTSRQLDTDPDAAAG